MLNILQTAFNGIVTDGDFCQILTDTSTYIAHLSPMKQSLQITLKKDSFKDMNLVVSGCELSVDGTIRHFDTPPEAFKASQKLVEKLKIAGYKPAKV